MIDKIFPHSYSTVLAELAERLKEPAPGKIQVLSGPRQVGKTHLLRELEKRHLGRVVYVAADAPVAARSGWWENQWRSAERLAGSGKTAILMFDEIQYLPDWGRRLKVEYDRLTHERLPIHVVVSGSSSLRIGHGTRETMAGRFEHLRLLHWPVRELVRHFSIPEEEAPSIAVQFGTYPGAIAFLDNPDRWAQYIRDAIIEPAIGRDIMAMEVIRKPALLRQVFALAAGHPAEIISLQKLQGQLADRGALETIAHYLHILAEAYLVAPIGKFTTRELRRRAAPSKLVVLNQGILGAMAPEGPKHAREDPAMWGRWVENACIAHAWNAGQTVSYWRQEPLEVDLIMSGSWGKWAVEVKTGGYTVSDFAGLLVFCERNPEYRPLVVCGRERERASRAAGIHSCTWQQFLLEGPSE